MGSKGELSGVSSVWKMVFGGRAAAAGIKDRWKEVEQGPEAEDSVCCVCYRP